MVCQETVDMELTYGSGVYMGVFPCRMYCVAWNTLNARPAKKSRGDNKPATGRNVKPVHSVKEGRGRLVNQKPGIYWEDKDLTVDIT